MEMFNRFQKHINASIVEGYGLTEGAVCSTLNPKDGKNKIGSVGLRLPYQHIKAVILDENNKYAKDAKTNEIGTICIKGPNIFKGYLNENHNKDIWIQDEWFNTGDLGKIDEDGFVFITGRKKDLIIRGGHNIDPSSIEEPLYKLDDISIVAAIGAPDKHAGEIPVAYVQLTKNSNISKDEILEWTKQNINEKAAIPKEIIITKEIPLTPIGKVFKPALRYDIINRIFKKELKAIDELVTSCKIKTCEDKNYGTKTMIIVNPKNNNFKQIEERIFQLLFRYSIHYEIINE
ncbi:MAG: AMP-binding protein [Desulfobacteraceae bacterium]|nr:AMP-binding protein [Desulfobacteraceae bacterium]